MVPSGSARCIIWWYSLNTARRLPRPQPALADPRDEPGDLVGVLLPAVGECLGEPAIGVVVGQEVLEVRDVGVVSAGHPDRGERRGVRGHRRECDLEPGGAAVAVRAEEIDGRAK